MRLFKVKALSAIFTLLLLAVSVHADDYSFHFKLDAGTESYRFGFSREPMTSMNSIPAPLNGDFDFGDTLTDVDENGDLFYYATTSDVYIYWRVISKEGFEIHLATKSALVNIEDPADVVPWTIKVNSIWGDVEQGDISTDFRNGYEVTGESNKPIYKFDGQTTTNWGCIRFDCTTDKVSKTGSYDSIISLVIEGK